MLKIVSMGHAHPKEIITNQFLEELDTGTTVEWIEDKIGIITRVTTLPLEYIKETKNIDPREALKVASVTGVDLGVSAAKMALDRGGVLPKQIGMILTNSCTPSGGTPTESQKIAAKLGISAPAFDVYSACPAFALHLDYLNNYDLDALPDYILCVSEATLTQRVNYFDRTDGAIWGDGAAAWIVTPRKTGTLAVTFTSFDSDPTRAEAVVVDRFGHFHQDGRAVRDFSVRQTVRLIKRLEEITDLDWSKDIFIGHQANSTMLQQITTNRHIPETNHWHNARDFGNQAGAGSAAVLSQNWDKLTSDMKIVIAVVGAGLSWGSALLEAQV
jgi:3-oxoacyl-[acyl-carrier-protein] synthase III